MNVLLLIGGLNKGSSRIVIIFTSVHSVLWVRAKASPFAMGEF